VTIRIVGVPISVYLLSSEHGDELMREFALIAAGTGAGGTGSGDGEATVPVRLTVVVEELRGRFSGFTFRPQSELAAAAARGDAAVDVVYTVPPAAAQAAAELAVLLDEADEFCRSGDLLTLATPPEALAFRRWFLDEFVRQAAGAPPTPWSEWKP
jgi:hypothetical protein